MSAPTSPVDVDAQVARILDATKSDLAVWRQIAETFRMVLLKGKNEGISLSPEALPALSERGIRSEIIIQGSTGDS